MTAAAAAVLVIVLAAGGASLLVRSRPPGVEAMPARATTLVGRRLRASPQFSAQHCAELLDAIGREVRCGSGMSHAFLAALRTVPAAAAHLAAELRMVDAGASVADALDRPRPDRGHVAVTIRAISSAARLGGAVAPALDSAASTMRQQAALHGEAEAHSAQARLSARILTVVPLGFALWSVTVSRSTRAAVTGSAVGVAVAGAGVVLNVAGWWWMRRTIAASTS